MTGDPGRLAMSVRHPDGTTTRWGYDALDPGDIPSDLTFGDATPGGHKSASCSLLRGLNPGPDEGLFNDVRIYGPGNQLAWGGRLAELPRETSGGKRVQPGAIGHAAHLEDFEGFMEVYVNYGPEGWTEPGLARRLAIAVAGGSYGAVSVSTEGGFTWMPTAGQTLAANEVTEVVFKAPPGVQITEMLYLGTEQGTWTSFDGPTWYTSATEDFASTSSGAMTFDVVSHVASLTAARYVMLRSRTSGSPTPAAGLARAMSQVILYGDHGLTTHSGGLYASDVIADVLSRAAPLLDFTTGADGTIQPTTFAIPHLSFITPTTAADVIARANAYHEFDWLVWDKTFHYQPAGSGVEWQARIGDGCELGLVGDSSEQVINGLIVAYQDNGITKYAGPVGSGMDVESSALQDDDEENPATVNGISWADGGKWPLLNLSVPTTDAGAVQLGSIYLAERNLAARRGQITLTGMVRHPDEGMVPVWRVRSGDTIKLTDRPGDPARRIVEKTYTHNGRQAVLSLDSTPFKLDAIVERLVAQMQTITA